MAKNICKTSASSLAWKLLCPRPAGYFEWKDYQSIRGFSRQSEIWSQDGRVFHVPYGGKLGVMRSVVRIVLSINKSVTISAMRRQGACDKPRKEWFPVEVESARFELERLRKIGEMYCENRSVEWRG